VFGFKVKKAENARVIFIILIKFYQNPIKASDAAHINA